MDESRMTKQQERVKHAALNVLLVMAVIVIILMILSALTGCDVLRMGPEGVEPNPDSAIAPVLDAMTGKESDGFWNVTMALVPEPFRTLIALFGGAGLTWWKNGRARQIARGSTKVLGPAIEKLKTTNPQAWTDVLKPAIMAEKAETSGKIVLPDKSSLKTS